MAAVQFYGKDSVLKAAENKDCSRWGIYSGKQFLFKYEGDSTDESFQLLEEILDALIQSQTGATYTIKFFETPGKITEKRECDGGSFNFKLIQAEEYNNRSLAFNSASDLDKRLSRMERAIEDMISRDLEERANELHQEEEEEEEEPQTALGFITGILQNPDMLKQYIGVAKMLFAGGGSPAQVAGVPGEQDAKITEAIRILKEKDPALGDHLMKLAKIAAEDPMTWKFLVSTLEKQ